MNSGVRGVAATYRVLLIDSDQSARARLTHILLAHDYVVDVVGNVREAVIQLETRPYDVVLIDIDDVGAAGREIAHSGALSSERLVAITRKPIAGWQCLIKPFDAGQLLTALEQSTRGALNARPRLVGRSVQMQKLFALIEQVAPTRATVLIQGETGTGKELVARSVHELSCSAHCPFVPVNCSALPETLLEAELFGHTKGSFTGAVSDRRGLFEEANGGTLFLDEITTISPAIQVKLLRVLQERAIRRVGSSALTHVQFRLIAASNADVASEVTAGRFRQDLYYRLNVFPITVPPLRERTGDIPLLVSHFRQKFSREHGVVPPAVEPDVLRAMSAYSWPGNVRELENCVERGIIMQDLDRTGFGQPAGVPQANVETVLLAAAHENRWDLARLEREYILEVLRSCGGHRARAAQMLGIDTRTLYRKLKLWT